MKSDVDIIDFATGTPLAKCLSPQLAEHFRLTPEAVLAAYDYASPAGSENLRVELLQAFGTSGLTSQNIVLTHGALQGIDLCSCAFSTDRPTVFVTDPTYREALTIFKSRGLPIETVSRTEAGGLDLKRVADHLDRGGQAMIYIVTHLNNPDGISLSETGQIELMSFSVERNIPIIEDDAYGDAYFDGRKTTTIFGCAQAINKSHLCIRIVSLSKRFMPGLRLAFLEAEETTMTKLVKSKHDFGLSPVLSAVAQSIFRHFNEVQSTMHSIRTHLSMGAEALTTACAKNGLSFIAPQGGYFLWVKVPFDNTAFLLKIARKNGVIFSIGEPFSPTNQSGYIRLSYSKEPPDRLILGADRLVTAINNAQTHGY